MRFRALILAPLLALAACAAQAAERIPLSVISDWLNALTTAEGSFTQINPDGTISTGRIYIHRPGRVRFEYDPPDPALVMAGGGAVAIFDGKSNEPPQQFPLKQTPLWVILDSDVDLGTADMITAHEADEVSTRIRAQDPERPEIGFIELVFTPDPVELRQWVITDDSGASTTVILGDMQRGGDMRGSLFSVQVELQKRRTNP